MSNYIFGLLKKLLNYVSIKEQSLSPVLLQDDYIIDGDYQAEVVEFTTKNKDIEGSGQREDDRINEI